MFGLRTFLLTVTSAIVAMTTVTFYLQAQGVLSQVFTNLEQVNQETVKNTSQSIVEARLYSLRTYRGPIENDNGLSSEWLLSKHDSGSQGLKTKISKLQEKMKLDLVDLADLRGIALMNGDLSAQQKDFALALAGQPREILTSLAGEPYLISLSALRNYGEPVAVLVLGYALNRTVAPQVSSTTRTEVKFALPDSQNATNVAVTDSSGSLIQIGYATTPRLLSDLAASTQRKFLLLGLISVVILFFLIFLGLEIGFIRPFRLLVGAVGTASEDLDKEVIRAPSMEKYRISEMDVLGRAFLKFTESLEKFSLRVREKTRREAQAEVAEQVAHDLKSPLSALDMMLKADTLSSVPEKGRNRLQACVERIREIVKQLSLQKRQETSELSELRLFWVYSLVDSLVAEKRVQYKDRSGLTWVWSANAETSGLFVEVSGTAFRRTLSNLIDNAVQALAGSGVVEVALAQDANTISVRVSDTGTGIAPEIETRLFERGATFGKEGGSGLGLFSAREFALSSGGEIQLSANSPRGTCAELKLPKAPIPPWFCGVLDFSTARTVAILDDDRAMREMWAARLGETKLSVQVFQTPRELSQWWDALSASDRPATLFLMDYELHGETLTGLDTIESLGVARQSVLVTSHAEREDIQLRCERLGVKILPKDLVPHSLAKGCV